MHSMNERDLQIKNKLVAATMVPLTRQLKTDILDLNVQNLRVKDFFTEEIK